MRWSTAASFGLRESAPASEEYSRGLQRSHRIRAVPRIRHVSRWQRATGLQTGARKQRPEWRDVTFLQIEIRKRLLKWQATTGLQGKSRVPRRQRPSSTRSEKDFLAFPLQKRLSLPFRVPFRAIDLQTRRCPPSGCGKRTARWRGGPPRLVATTRCHGPKLKGASLPENAKKPRRRALQVTRRRGRRGIAVVLRSEAVLLDDALKGLATGSEKEDGECKLDEFHDEHHAFLLGQRQHEKWREVAVRLSFDKKDCNPRPSHLVVCIPQALLPYVQQRLIELPKKVCAKEGRPPLCGERPSPSCGCRTKATS